MGEMSGGDWGVSPGPAGPPIIPVPPARRPKGEPKDERDDPRPLRKVKEPEPEPPKRE